MLSGGTVDCENDFDNVVWIEMHEKMKMNKVQLYILTNYLLNLCHFLDAALVNLAKGLFFKIFLGSMLA